jgi:hypothetical protein
MPNSERSLCDRDRLPELHFHAKTSIQTTSAKPLRYRVPDFVGSKALRIDFPEVEWEDVEDLLTAAYRLLARKSLAVQV